MKNIILILVMLLLSGCNYVIFSGKIVHESKFTCKKNKLYYIVNKKTLLEIKKPLYYEVNLKCVKGTIIKK